MQSTFEKILKDGEQKGYFWLFDNKSSTAIVCNMTNAKKQNQILDKKRLLREVDHLTRPPRLEGAAKNNMMNPTRKKVKSREAGKK